MFCGRCGAPIPLQAGYCPRCGSQVVTPPSVPIPTTSSSAAGSESSRRKTIAVAAAAVYLTLVFVISAIYWERQEDDWPSAVGFEIGTALIPTIIVLLYYYFKRKQKPS